MLFKPNYLKPGKGLPEKRDPNQSRFSIFFEILGEKFWDLIKLNLLYVLFSIPAFIVTCVVMGFLSTLILNSMSNVTIPQDGLSFVYIFFNVFFAIGYTTLWGLGPSTAGLTYTLRNISREEHVWLFSDFWQKIKENFKQAFCLWIIDLVLFYLIMFAYNFYQNAEGLAYLRYVLIFFAIICTMIHLFVYQLMITFKLPLKVLIKNAFILSVANAPRSILLLIITALIHIVLPYVAIINIASPIALIIFFALEILILPTLTSFIINFFIYPILEKYIKIANENK